MSFSLFEPAQLGPLSLKNRTVRSATNEHLSSPEGQFTSAWVAALEELARNDVGLIITGHLSVDRTQRADEGQPVLDQGADLGILAQATQTVHRHGVNLVAQISHSGRKARQAVNGRPPLSPADFSAADLDWLVAQFQQAALLARQAGFDGVQIHCAHGYLLSSFLNPEQNHRTDGYGGDLPQRFFLIRRILSAVREACGPDFALLAKADGDGRVDLSALLHLFQQAGVDGIEVSGSHFSIEPGGKFPYCLDYLLASREGISVPLFLVGGIFSRTAAQRVLDAGIPFASFSRALICQPDFVARMKAGEDESLCTACSSCYKVYRQRPVRCVLHQTPIPQLEAVFGPYPSE